MVSFRSRRQTVAVNAVLGLVMLQLGVRGFILWLNETGGNTHDVIGDINGPKYWWMLIPESWTIDLIVRSTFWVLLPLAVFFLARAAAASSVPKGKPIVPGLSVGILIALAAWTLFIGVWGLLVVATSDAIEWAPPEIIFPTVLYLVIHRIWPIFIGIAGVLGYFAWRLRRRIGVAA